MTNRSLYAVLACVAAAAAAALPAAMPTDISPSIEWKPCPSDVPAPIECGELVVPMDYDHPSDANITLSLLRLRANGTDRLGSLFMNPGGPGGSGRVTVLIQAELEQQGVMDAVVSYQVRQRYDLIGADPRGVGKSTPARCDPETQANRTDYYVSDEKGFQELVEHNQALGNSCLEITGPALRYIDTISAARDHDEIRKALGEDKFNWLGFSYGSQLGAQYIELFPDKVGRMVLDGAVDHSGDAISNLLKEATTYERTLNAFFDWCNTTTECIFHNQDLPTIFDDLVDRAESNPIPAPGCKDPEAGCREDVTAYDILRSVQPQLAFVDASATSDSWAELARNLHRAAVDGNATSMGPFIPRKETYGFFGERAIECLDWPRVGSAAELARHIVAVRALVPHTRGVSETFEIQAGCAGWPVPATNLPRRLDTEKTGRACPVLVVNALLDPETSVAWAVGLREQLPSAVSLFRDGAGHTSYGLVGETSRAIDAYLLEGTLPEDGTVYAS